MCGLQKSAIDSARAWPWRMEAKICWSRTRVKNVLKAVRRVAAGHWAWRTKLKRRKLYELARSRRSTIRYRLMRAYARKSTNPAAAFSSPTAYQPRPTVSYSPWFSSANPPIDPDRRGGQEGDADPVAVPDQVDGQCLPLERVVDGLVAALDLVPLEVDEHVRQAGADPHEQRRRCAQDGDPRGGPGRCASQTDEDDEDAQEEGPRRPGEEPLPDPEAGPDAAADSCPEDSQRRTDKADPVERVDQDGEAQRASGG